MPCTFVPVIIILYMQILILQGADTKPCTLAETNID